MAKGRSDSKVAVAGALALVLAIAGVLLVKEPLRSSRPVGTGLEMKHTTGEQMVRARLWEDPVAAGRELRNGSLTSNTPAMASTSASAPATATFESLRPLAIKKSLFCDQP